jgi:hypothetical protein
MRYELIGLGMDYRRRHSATVTPVQAVLALLVVAAIGVVTAWSLVPPEPVGSDAWPDAFSAERAVTDIEAIVAVGPHPTGSEANDQVREYLVERLKEIGYSPHVQYEWIRPRYRGAGSDERAESVLVHNILARLDSERSGPALMVTAHYDSVPAGPGAMDDAAGVAIVLQIAEALYGAEVQNPVIFHLSDGEELGLLGAQAFTAYHPWAEDVEVVINLESRGSSGLGLMFETGDGNRELVRLFGQLVQRPAGSSTFYSLYKQLPNDTDFTVYKRAGMVGMNLANIGTPQNYHTADDNLENLDRRTLQHLGDTTMSLVKGLADADLESMKSDSDSVFFDVFTRWCVHYPEGFALPLAAIALAISLLALSRVGSLQRERPAFSLVAGSIGFVVSAAAAFVVGLGAIALIKLILPQVPATGFLEHHVPTAVAVLSAVAAGALAPLAAMMHLSGLAELWGGALVWWNAAVIASAIFLPGVTYLFVFPVIACAAGLAVLSFVEPSSGWGYFTALLPGIAVTSILWSPYVGLLTLMGGPLTLYPFAPVVLVASVLGPMLVGQRGAIRWIPAAVFGLVSIAFVAVTYFQSV